MRHYSGILQNLWFLNCSSKTPNKLLFAFLQTVVLSADIISVRSGIWSDMPSSEAAMDLSKVPVWAPCALPPPWWPQAWAVSLFGPEPPSLVEVQAFILGVFCLINWSLKDLLPFGEYIIMGRSQSQTAMGEDSHPSGTPAGYIYKKYGAASCAYLGKWQWYTRDDIKEPCWHLLSGRLQGLVPCRITGHSSGISQGHWGPPPWFVEEFNFVIRTYDPDFSVLYQLTHILTGESQARHWQTTANWLHRKISIETTLMQWHQLLR